MQATAHQIIIIWPPDTQYRSSDSSQNNIWPSEVQLRSLHSQKTTESFSGKEGVNPLFFPASRRLRPLSCLLTSPPSSSSCPQEGGNQWDGIMFAASQLRYMKCETRSPSPSNLSLPPASEERLFTFDLKTFGSVWMV